MRTDYSGGKGDEDVAIRLEGVVRAHSATEELQADEVPEWLRMRGPQSCRSWAATSAEEIVEA